MQKQSLLPLQVSPAVDASPEERPLAPSLQLIHDLKSLFIANGWELNEATQPTFDGFYDTLSRMQPREQAMMLKITRSFRWIQFPQYTALIAPPIKAAIAKSQARRIFIIPMLKRADYNKNKSSRLITYLVKTLISRQLGGSYSLHFPDTPTSDVSRFRSDDLAILVDDFVGSGRTCITATEEMLEGVACSPKVVACAMFAMQHSEAELRKVKVELFVNKLLPKGITDNPDLADPEKPEFARLMEEIENALRIRPEYRFGLERSESLISFDRCPNNTFPVYWADQNKNKSPRCPPFFRP